MIRTINKHQRWLMIIIAILAIPFIFYFNKTDLGAQRNDLVVRLYDRNVSAVEARRYGKMFELARQLGMFNFVQDLTLGAQDQNSLDTYFTVNLIILQHEAREMGIKPTQAEIVELIRKMPVFRGADGFDSKKYDEITQNLLYPNGFMDSDLEELAGYEITLNRLKDLVSAGVALSQGESKAIFEQFYGKTAVSVARLRLEDFARNVTVADDDMQKYYEAHKNELKTEEKRKVAFVALVLSEEEKKLQGKERIEVLQKLSNKADDFSQALLEKGADFKQVAAKFQSPVKETGEFSPSAPDPLVKNDRSLQVAAFQLTQQEPNSEPVQTADGYYILHLTGVVEARPLTLDEAKPKITEAIKTQRAREMLSNKGMQAANELRETLRSGAPLQFALEKANLKAEKVPAFAVADEMEPKAEPEAEKPDAKKPDAKKPEEKNPADLPFIKRAVTDLAVGDVSEFTPSSDGGFIAIVEKRDPPDEKAQASRASFDERYLTNKRRVAFYEWLRNRHADARVMMAKDETAPTVPGS